VICQSFLEEFREKKISMDQAKKAYDEARWILLLSYDQDDGAVELGDSEVDVKEYQARHITFPRLVAALGQDRAVEIRNMMPSTRHQMVQVK
jgi:hypothetical protein